MANLNISIDSLPTDQSFLSESIFFQKFLKTPKENVFCPLSYQYHDNYIGSSSVKIERVKDLSIFLKSASFDVFSKGDFLESTHIYCPDNTFYFYQNGRLLDKLPLKSILEIKELNFLVNELCSFKGLIFQFVKNLEEISDSESFIYENLAIVSLSMSEFHEDFKNLLAEFGKFPSIVLDVEINKINLPEKQEEDQIKESKFTGSYFKGLFSNKNSFERSSSENAGEKENKTSLKESDINMVVEPSNYKRNLKNEDLIDISTLSNFQNRLENFLLSKTSISSSKKSNNNENINSSNKTKPFPAIYLPVLNDGIFIKKYGLSNFIKPNVRRIFFHSNYDIFGWSKSNNPSKPIKIFYTRDIQCILEGRISENFKRFKKENVDKSFTIVLKYRTIDCEAESCRLRREFCSALKKLISQKN